MDPDKNPNIHGTPAHQARVRRDVDRTTSRHSMPSTLQGRIKQRELQRDYDDLHRIPVPPPPIVRGPSPRSIDPLLPRDAPLPAGELAPLVQRPIARPERTARQTNSIFQPVNLVCAIAGALGVIFAMAQGVQNGLGLGAVFVASFVATGVLIRYFKVFVGIAMVGYLIYEIIHQLAKH